MKNIRINSKLRNYIPVLLVFLLTVTSCEDYLEEQPSTLIDSDYIFTTEEGLKAGVVSLYKFERDRYDNGTEDYMGAVAMSSRGDLTFSRSGYTGLVGRYERATTPEDLGTRFLSTLFWKHYYNIANKATAIINAAEEIEGISDASRNQIISEAKFFRAHSYFYLYRMYNNIYVTTETITVDSAFDVVNDRSTDAEIFALINSDLEFAIEHLEWTDTFGRVTKGTAKHVRAKTAMWQGDWTEARDQAVSTINDGPHSLLPSTGAVFGNDFNHAESLFVLRADQNLLGGGGSTMMNANYVAQYFNISGVSASVDQGGRGFSRIVPNLYLLGLLAEDPNDDRDNNTYFRKEFFYNEGPNTGQQITIYRPITSTTPSNNYILYYTRLAPSCIKFAQPDDNPDSYLQWSNTMVYRLAETHLIAAEAYMRLNDETNARLYVNNIRTRANASPIPSNVVIDEVAILDERARELAFEGQRWFTLKRMGQAVMDRQMTTYAGDGAFYPANLGSKDPRTNWRSQFINFPIAQIDLDLLGPTYPQNAGY